MSLYCPDEPASARYLLRPCIPADSIPCEQVWACLGLMILSAGLGGWTDLSFSAEGYAWQLVNCIFTAAYSLHLSSVVRAAGNAAAASAAGSHKDGGPGAGPGAASSTADRGGSSQHKYHGELAEALSQRHSVRVDRAGGDGGGGTQTAGGVPGARRGGGGKLNELSMVYYNNVLSVPPLLLLSLMFGEPMRLRNYQHASNPEFTVVVLMGALLGFGVSFASIWCMSRTSATIYSLTGSMNKVVVAVVGMYAFREPINFTNLLSIAMGLGAGFLFVFAKSTPQGKEDKEKDRSSRPNSSIGVEEERQALLGGGEESGQNGLVGGAIVGPSVGAVGAGPNTGIVITVGAGGAVGGGQMLSARTSGGAAGLGLSRVVSTGSGGGGSSV